MKTKFLYMALIVLGVNGFLISCRNPWMERITDSIVKGKKTGVMYDITAKTAAIINPDVNSLLVNDNVTIIGETSDYTLYDNLSFTIPQGRILIWNAIYRYYGSNTEAVALNGDGDFKITGGIIESISNSIIAPSLFTGNIYMSGGKLDGQILTYDCTFTMTGGIINGNLTFLGQKATISGSSYITNASSGYTISFSNSPSKIIINGGHFENTLTPDNVIFVNGQIYVYGSATMNPDSIKKSNSSSSVSYCSSGTLLYFNTTFPSEFTLGTTLIVGQPPDWPW